MAIKITEDGNVIYENEPTVERELLPNITDGEQYAKQAEEALERIEEIAESIPEDYSQLSEDVAELKIDLSEKADKSEALSAYIVETETGSIASFTDGADDVPVKDLTVAIEPVQGGSGDPSPSNVRPISGWTGAVVSVFDVNLWDEEWEVGGIENATGIPFSASDRFRSKNFCKCVPNTSYYGKAPTMYMSVFWYDVNHEFINRTAGSNTVINSPANAYYLKIVLTDATTYSHDISINYPATDTDYHAYNGSSVSVDWTTEAGTVYGGTLDVTSGVLTVTNGYVDLGTLTWAGSGSSDNKFYASLPSKSTAHNNNGICSYYTWGNVYLLNDDKRIQPRNLIVWIQDSQFNNSTADIASTLSGQYLAYELATPQTYQLTPQEVSTILGQNNIFADCGNVTVQYRADTKLYIDKVVNA